jgi:xylulokinase
MTNGPLLTGLDVGTTNIKALIFTPDGQVVSQASLPTPTHRPQPGQAYYEPEELWLAVATALKQATANVDARRIVSIAIASMGEAGVPLDAQNHPLYPAIAWFDSRTQPQADWLDQVLGKDSLFAITGLSLQPIFGLCKLLWLKQNHPDAFARAVRWLNIADYIAFRLCGEQATEFSLASRTLALDITHRYWSDAVLHEAGISASLFAPLCASGTRLGSVTSEASSATGLPVTASVASGGHDHVCGALAAGVTTPGMVLNSLGTSETIFLSLDKPLTDPQVGRQGYTQGAHVVPGLYYVFGSLYTSGRCVEWFRANFADNQDYTTLIDEAQQIPSGSQGVCFLPHLQLASSPYDDPQGRGAFIGLGTEVTRATLFRSVLEGIAYDSRQILETLQAYETVPALQAIYAIGGATRNRLLMRIKATVLNRPIFLTDVSDAASLGAAILGGLGAGIYPDVPVALTTLRHETTRVDPLEDQVALYEQIYTQVYKQLYPALSHLHHALEPIRRKGA